MKLIMENWRKFTNEGKKKKTAIIKTVRGDEEVDISYELGNFFIYKTTNRSKSHYFVTHKPSGNMIPSSYYAEKYGYKYANLKKMLKDIDSMLDSEELSKEKPSMEALKSLASFLTKKESMNEAASKETADSFKKLAAAFGDVSSSITDDAEASEEMKGKFDELYSQFEKIGLDKIPDLGELMKNIENGEGLAELTKSLQDAGIKPEEMGEKLEQIQVLRDEFDEYRKEQEENQEERDERQAEIDQDQDRADKEASRERADMNNAEKAREAEAAEAATAE